MNKRQFSRLMMILSLALVCFLVFPTAVAFASVQQTEKDAPFTRAQLKVKAQTYLMSQPSNAGKYRLMRVPSGALVIRLSSKGSYDYVQCGGYVGYIHNRYLTSSWGKGKIGSIIVPGTTIEYPILIANDNAYYMTHDEKGIKNSAGSIFADFRNVEPDRRKNLILYGHNRKDGSMFAPLHNYKDNSFFLKHDGITVEFNGELGFEQEERVFHVFASAVMHTREDMNYWRTQFADQQAFSDFVQAIYETCKQKAKLGDGQVISGFRSKSVKQLLTLSTCTHPDDKTGRYVVFAYHD